MFLLAIVFFSDLTSLFSSKDESVPVVGILLGNLSSVKVKRIGSYEWTSVKENDFISNNSYLLSERDNTRILLVDGTLITLQNNSSVIVNLSNAHLSNIKKKVHVQKKDDDSKDKENLNIEVIDGKLKVKTKKSKISKTIKTEDVAIDITSPESTVVLNGEQKNHIQMLEGSGDIIYDEKVTTLNKGEEVKLKKSNDPESNELVKEKIPKEKLNLLEERFSESFDLEKYFQKRGFSQLISEILDLLR